MKKLLFLALFIPLQANAVWKGKLDLNASAQPIVMREAHDGQWLAGIAHPGLWCLYHNDNALFHLGVFQAWNAEHGNASFGPLAGLDLLGVSKEVGADIPKSVAALGEWTGAPSIFKPAVLFSQILSIDAFVGYRPVHTQEVDGNLVYGGAATLKIPFGVKELQSGL